MTALLPTRVSIYDFLIQDTQPIDSIVADIGHISLPQARILIENGCQAIVSALLAYQQILGGDAVLKKLLQRSQVKELRKHNAFNLKTMATAMQYGQPFSDALFQKNNVQQLVCQHLAQPAHLTQNSVKPILAALCLLCLRELAILADFAQLDSSEIDLWLQQQTQFLQPTCERSCLDNTPTGLHHLPKYDPIWHSFTGYQPLALTSLTQQDSMPHYAKAIGRTQHLETPQQPSDMTATTGSKDGLTALTHPPLSAVDKPKVVDINNNSTVLTFVPMANISLPYQRWLLQLAKIADTYLSRNRLKIAPEPKQPPTRPLVSFGFMEEQTKTTASEQPIEYDKAAPFWRSHAFLILMMIIGGLCLLAVGKYHYKQFMQPAYSDIILEGPTTDHSAKDIAIVRIPEEDESH